MVKVYDMVTYEVCASDNELPVIQNAPARTTDHADLRLEIGLPAYGTRRREDLLPLSMRGVDITAFLAAIAAD